jgi:hypothetical protein
MEPRLSVTLIVTPDYLDFWKQRATSSDAQLKPSDGVTIYLSTDQVGEAEIIYQGLR